MYPLHAGTWAHQFKLTQSDLEVRCSSVQCTVSFYAQEKKKQKKKKKNTKSSDKVRTPMFAEVRIFA